MKKRLLFSLMAIILAAIWFGGVSVAAEASIWGVSYDSLVDAIAQANGKTVKLENNVSLTNMLMIENTTITLDLNGYNIEKTNWNVIFVGTNGNLTIEWTWFVWIPTDNNDGTAIVVKSWWKATINNWSYQGWTAVYAYGTDSEVTINSWNFIGTKSWNRAAIHSVVDSLITINWWRFTAQPTDSWKPQKVIYAWANTNKCNTPSTTDSDLYVPWKIIVNGWYLQWRFSRSNLWEYEIKSWTLKPYQDITAWVNCNYNNCDNGTDDPKSCTNMPGVTSMLNEWYVATSDGEWAYVISYDPAATIWENGYSTVDAAINAATQWQTVEILKAWTYTLPNLSVNIAIKWTVDGVIFAHDYADNNGIISTIANWVTFENVWFNLTNNSSSTANHYFKQTAWTVIMSGCTINWLIHTMWDMQFDNCTFITNVWYNIWTQIWNVTFNGWEIINNASSRLVNVYQHNWTNPGNNRYTITFNWTKFTNNWSAWKWALNIHEVADQTIKYVLQYTINMDNVTTEWTFATDKPWYLPYFSVEDIIVWTVTDWVAADLKWSPTASDVSSWTLNWGDILVKVDWATKYSTPKAGQEQWIVTFDWTNTWVVNNWDKVEKPADPAAQGCKTFVEWQLNGVAYDFNSVVTWNLALTSKWSTSSCWGGGGSSSSSSSSSNKTWDNNTWATAESGTTADTWANTPTVDPQGVAANGYTNEMNEAYEFAYANGITTMKSIDEAEMLDGLTRIAMAKMLSQYAINVLGKSPADVEVPNFTDVSADLDAEYANGVSLAYKLWIMWINMPDNKFLPYETVTRAQFGTALSRLLFGIEDGEDAYYSTHLKKLKEAWIITNDDPTLEELRGYVMLMLMRSSKGSNTVSTSTEPAVSNENTNTSAHEVANEPKEEQEVEAYFTEAYRKWQIYGRIWDLQRLLKSLWYYNGDINNTFDNNTIDAVFDFQIAMWILPADDKSSARWNVWPKTRDVLNQKWVEFNK